MTGERRFRQDSCERHDDPGDRQTFTRYETISKFLVVNHRRHSDGHARFHFNMKTTRASVPLANQLETLGIFRKSNAKAIERVQDAYLE